MIFSPQNATQLYLLTKTTRIPTRTPVKSVIKISKLRSCSSYSETWEKYSRLQNINELSLRGNTRTDRGNSMIILKWKQGLLATGDSQANHSTVSYDCTRSHHIYQQANSKDFVHSSILSAMNNVQHSRVNNRNIYLPRARVSGSWPAILDAFSPGDHVTIKTEKKVSVFLGHLTCTSGKHRSCSNRQTDRGTSTCFSLFFSFLFFHFRWLW